MKQRAFLKSDLSGEWWNTPLAVMGLSLDFLACLEMKTNT